MSEEKLYNKNGIRYFSYPETLKIYTGIECPECNNTVSVTPEEATGPLVNAENGYWRAKFFWLDFKCRECSKDTRVLIKKEPNRSLHGHYKLRKADYEVRPGLKIVRGLYEDGRYIPDIKTLESFNNVRDLFLLVRFVNNYPDKYFEEVQYFMQERNIDFIQLFEIFLEMLHKVVESPDEVFGAYKYRDYPAFIKELDGGIKFCEVNYAQKYLLMLANLQEEAETQDAE